MEVNLLERKKINILKNIKYAKERNINKISALLVCDEEETHKELLAWLIYEGYKVSLNKSDINILTIEW